MIVMFANLICYIMAYIDYNNIGDLTKAFQGLTPFIDVEYQIDSSPVKKRIRFKLFWDKTPKTALNFAMLIKGYVNGDGELMKFKGSHFHRIIKNFVMQGGDFTKGNGTGGNSIYNGNFPDESFHYKHDVGVLSMANRGKNTNSSQFFITFSETHYLNNKHVVFGKVKDEESMRVVREIEKVKTNDSDQPVFKVTIVDSGFENIKKESL